MVKIKGPMTSLAATGTLGGNLVFSTWKGKPYVRQHVKPTNPKTAGQVAIRAMMTFLSHEWIGLTLPQKTTWAEMALAANESPMNAYIAYNINRWRSLKAPSKSYPALEEHDDFGDTCNAVGHIHYVHLTVPITVEPLYWGVLFYRSPNVIDTPTWNQLVTIVKPSLVSNTYHDDGPLLPGTYHYNPEYFMKDGSRGQAIGDIQATVTD